MIAFLRKLLWDETAFVRYSRAALVGLGALATQMPSLPAWFGPAAMAAGVFLGAGDKNNGGPVSPKE